MKGKEGTGDPGGPDAKSGRYSSGSRLCLSGEKCFFADLLRVARVRQADMRDKNGNSSEYHELWLASNTF